ncbi:MAG: hypothetical protein HYY16_18460 [Planctomycetes bacterium]|nr:hypothetical protein [Planctomycetota bacterium]
MATIVSKDKLQRIGRALPTPRVLRQARYTLALMESDPEVMAVLGRDFVSEVRAAVDALDASDIEHQLARIASKEATREERDVMVQARRYRHAFVTRMVSARCRGAELPEAATRNGTRAFNASLLSEDLERLIGLVLPIADGLANAGVSGEFLREGEEHVRRLKESSLRQELAIRTIQRDALSRRRELTARLHLALKAILNAGKSVHVGDAAKLKQYTFAILRRPVRDHDEERIPQGHRDETATPGIPHRLPVAARTSSSAACPSVGEPAAKAVDRLGQGPPPAPVIRGNRKSLQPRERRAVARPTEPADGGLVPVFLSQPHQDRAGDGRIGPPQEASGRFPLVMRRRLGQPERGLFEFRGHRYANRQERVIIVYQAVEKVLADIFAHAFGVQQFINEPGGVRTSARQQQSQGARVFGILPKKFDEVQRVPLIHFIGS